MAGSSIGVSLICRNEEDNIENCIDSVYQQTVKPKMVVVADDGSTDSTPQILRKMKKKHDNLKILRLKAPRFKIKGWNISNAIDASLKILLENCETPYIMRMDSDVVLDNKRYVETLLNALEKDPKIGITGGCSDQGKLMIRHVTDAARIYNRKCLLQCLEQTPTKTYPIMYGHDSFMIFTARWLGWKVKPVHVTFHDARPYRREMKRWFLTGRFRYMNGYTLIHAIGLTVRYMRQTPYIIGALTAFLTFLLCHLRKYKIFNPDYYRFMKEDMNKIVVYFIRNFLSLQVLRRFIY